MDSEEGEILETTGDGYDPALEWPGEPLITSYPYTPSYSGDPLVRVPALRPHQPTFRLIVLRSSILPAKHTLGVIDGHSEIQFGRDVVPSGSTTPKIRLKEMEVSKLHATAYWDASRQEWGVVDMGSMHGTYLQSATSNEDSSGARLSPARQASIPKKLSHLDRLTIGGTTFLVHMHQNCTPCEECQANGRNEIPLRPVSKSSKPAVPEPVKGADGSYAPKDPKRALSMLKQSLLTRHSDSGLRQRSTPPIEQTSVQYVDRSARRRALMPASHPDAPGVSTPPLFNPLPPTLPPRPKSPNVAAEPTSQPPVPLPPSNIGHRLLIRQGWEPGTALGPLLDGSGGLVEPIEPIVSLNRGGLGLKRTSTTSLPELSGHDWKETGKRRRWDRS